MHYEEAMLKGVAVSPDGLGCIVHADGTLLVTRDDRECWEEMSLGMAGEIPAYTIR
jgi:hypothetical protein